MTSRPNPQQDKKAAQEALEEIKSQLEALRDARGTREVKEAVAAGSKVKTRIMFS